MTTVRRVDATGRSSGRFKVVGPRTKKWKIQGQYVHHPRNLLESPGWRALTMPARRIIDFLEIEHLAHGGQENGQLVAPYAQLQKAGVSSRDIRGAFDMLEAFGIVRRTDEQRHRRERQGGRKNTSRFRLTWLPDYGRDELPTCDYERVTQAEIDQFFEQRRSWVEMRSVQKAKAA